MEGSTAPDSTRRHRPWQADVRARSRLPADRRVKRPSRRLSPSSTSTPRRGCSPARTCGPCPPLPAIGLRSLVMSDGPIGVRGVRWTADDPSIALPSPDRPRRHLGPGARPPRRAAARPGGPPQGRPRPARPHGQPAPLPARRPPLRGVQRGPVPHRRDRHRLCARRPGRRGRHHRQALRRPTTPRPTASPSNNLVAARALRELYLAPFEAIVENAHPWGIMAAYNQVNGSTMTEHRYLQNERAARRVGLRRLHRLRLDGRPRPPSAPSPAASTSRCPARAPSTARRWPPPSAPARSPSPTSTSAVRKVLRLAARVGVLERRRPPWSPTCPPPIDGEALAREIARRSFVLRPQRGTRRRCRPARWPAGAHGRPHRRRRPATPGCSAAARRHGLPRPRRLPARRAAPPPSPKAR